MHMREDRQLEIEALFLTEVCPVSAVNEVYEFELRSPMELSNYCIFGQ